MKSRIVSNYIYNLVFQFVNLAIPLITTPYLSRVLGADGIGTFSYYHSIASVFTIFIILGLSNYGSRSIAKCLDDVALRNRTFCELFYLQVLLGVVVSSLYVGVSFFFDNTKIALLLLPVLLANTFDVGWYLYGRENFKVVSLIGVSLKVLSAACFFLFVRSRDDVPLYAFVMAQTTLASQLIAMPIVFKEVHLVRVEVKDLKKHIKPNLILFIPVVAVSIYRTMDKVMLGAMTDMSQVGYYDNAEKIISILVGIIAALGTVMIPRVSALFQENNTAAIKSLLNKTIIFVALVSSAISFGVLAVSHDLIIWFLGDKFYGSISVLRLLCITVPFLSFANVIRTQLLIPQGNDRPFVVSSIAGAVVNVLINALLIPIWEAKGAAIATIIAECSVFVIQFFYVKQDLDLKGILITMLGLYFNGAIMMIIVSYLQKLLPFTGFVNLLIEVLIGAFVFFALLYFQYFVLNDKALHSITEHVKMK